MAFYLNEVMHSITFVFQLFMILVPDEGNEAFPA